MEKEEKVNLWDIMTEKAIAISAFDLILWNATYLCIGMFLQYLIGC